MIKDNKTLNTREGTSKRKAEKTSTSNTRERTSQRKIEKTNTMKDTKWVLTRDKQRKRGDKRMIQELRRQ